MKKQGTGRVVEARFQPQTRRALPRSRIFPPFFLLPCSFTAVVRPLYASSLGNLSLIDSNNTCQINHRITKYQKGSSSQIRWFKKNIKLERPIGHFNAKNPKENPKATVHSSNITALSNALISLPAIPPLREPRQAAPLAVQQLPEPELLAELLLFEGMAFPLAGMGERAPLLALK